MFERRITFYCTDEELERAIPRLVKARLDFSAQHIDSQKKESWSITTSMLVKDQLARILYGQ
jgi:hypothetical protein